MTTAIKRRRGTTAQHSTFTGLEGELTVDTTKDTVVVHDGITAGGFPLAKDAEVVHLTGTETVAGVKTFSSNPVLSAGTANGVAYLNGSKALTSGSALTFDGSTFSALSGGTTVVSSRSSSGQQAFVSAIGNAGTVGTSSFDMIQDGSSVAYLYQRANQPMIFGVNNTEQMRLTSTGLGIGTSSPAYRLQLNSGSAVDIETGVTNSAGLSRYGTRGSGNAFIGAFTAGKALEFWSAGSQNATLNSSGNLGLGVTPSAWSQGRAMELAGTGYGVWNGTGSMYMLANTYFDSGFKYANTGAQASHYYQFQGAHVWSTAPSGTAGNAISFTQAMTLDASGNLLVGTTNVTDRVTVDGGGFAVAWADDRKFWMAFNNDYRLGMRLNAATRSTTLFSTGAAGDGGVITFNTRASASSGPTDYGIERARIDSSGNFIKSAPTTPPTLSTNGQMVFNLTSDTNLRVSVRGSDGVTRTANITLA